MKKITVIFIIFVFLISISACKKEIKNEDPQNMVSSETLKHYYNDDVYFDYETNHYKFRLPKYWKNKFVAQVSKGREDFFEQGSYDENGSGLLFSIYEYEDDAYKSELTNYTYLCYDDRFGLHYVLVKPDTDEYLPEYEENYTELKKGITIVTSTFKAEM